MTDGTYLGPQTVAPVPTNLADAQDHALTLWSDIDALVSAIPGPLTRVFLVGAGGSYLGLQAALFVLDSCALTPSVAMNSDEFYFRAPPSVGAGTLVVLLSGAGKTPETIRAGRWAVQRGATVAAVTLRPDGALAQSLDNVFVAQAVPGAQILLQLLALAVLKRDGVDIADKREALHALPIALQAAVENFEPRAAEIAEAMKDVPVTHLIASGPLIGPAAVLTTCYLQEMQWMHAATINADEFFQGPFEVIDAETKTIVFLGEDETRPMGERVASFLATYSGDTYYVDGKDLDLPGVAPEQRAFVAPLVYDALVSRMAAHYAAARGYALEGRRYMWKVDY